MAILSQFTYTRMKKLYNHPQFPYLSLYIILSLFLVSICHIHAILPRFNFTKMYEFFGYGHLAETFDKFLVALLYLFALQLGDLVVGALNLDSFLRQHARHYAIGYHMSFVGTYAVALFLYVFFPANFYLFLLAFLSAQLGFYATFNASKKKPA
jgi:hypothetical protein